MMMRRMGGMMGFFDRETVSLLREYLEKGLAAYTPDEDLPQYWNQLKMDATKKFFIHDDGSWLDRAQAESPLIRQACRLDQAYLLMTHLTILNRQTNEHFRGVIDNLRLLINELAAPLSGTPGSTVISEETDNSLVNQLKNLRRLFLKDLGSIRSGCTLVSQDETAAIPTLIKITKKAFIKFIKMFKPKQWQDRTKDKDRAEEIPPIPPENAHLTSIITALGVIKLELESARVEPDKRRALLTMVQGSLTGVTTLKETTSVFIKTLINQTLQIMLHTAGKIQEDAKGLFNKFQRYCADVITTLPFWMFLPNDAHYNNYIKEAIKYLIHADCSLKFAHFVAAFESLLEHE